MTAASFERVTIITPPTDCDVGGVWEVIEEYPLPGGDSHVRLRQGNSYFGTQRSNVMTAADKPRADLVALLLAFEASAPGSSSLVINGREAAAAILAWADLRGHRVVTRQMDRVCSVTGRRIGWTSYLAQAENDPVLPRWEVRCAVHDDHEVTAQADQQVLARVQAVFTTDRDEDGNRIMDPAEVAAQEGVEQPKAAEGGV